MAIETVILIGARGHLGHTVLSALLPSVFQVIVLACASSKSTFPNEVSVIKILDEYPESDLIEVFHGQDAIVCRIAALNASAEVHLIKAVLQAHFRRFIPADFGLEIRNTESLALILTTADEVAIWEELIAHEAVSCIYDLAAHTALTLNGGETLFSATSLATIRTAVVRTLKREEMTWNQSLFIQSFTASQNAILTALEKNTGHSWVVERQGDAIFIENSQKR